MERLKGWGAAGEGGRSSCKMERQMARNDWEECEEGA